jgi:hypothetical protein
MVERAGQLGGVAELTVQVAALKSTRHPIR